MGAESTGKTTLAAVLAKYYGTVWVPEYARRYLKENGGKRSSIDIMLSIAEGQATVEESFAEQAKRLLICDTNLLSTPIWSERYFGKVDEKIIKMANECKCDLYLLADIDMPWVDDGIRYSAYQRERMHYRFLLELTTRQLPFVILSGSFEERMAKAISYIDSLLLSQDP